MAKSKASAKKAAADKASNKKSTAKKAAVGKATVKQVSSDDLPKKSLQDVMPIAKAILDHYAGKDASWEEIAQALEFSTKTPNNRYLLWSAVAYGVITKGDNGTYSVSEVGRKILAPTYENEDREGKIKAAAAPKILSKFFADYSGSKLPSGDIFRNVLELKYGVPKARVDETIQLLLDNARFAGLLDESNDSAFALRSSNAAFGVGDDSAIDAGGAYAESPDTTESTSDFENACFIITPIGDEGSPERKHADALLKHLISPVLEKVGIKAVRADGISKPGHITKQVVEYIAYSRLCITDLSFGNQNAHYELGVRHALKKPSVQIIRKGDKIPFDIQQGRTIIIDTSDPYTIMDRVASARAELTEHIQALLSESGGKEDSPITMYLPKLVVKIG